MHLGLIQEILEWKVKFIVGGCGVLKEFKDKIMLSSFILFLIVGGVTFNFYNSMSIILKRICLASTSALLIIVIICIISEKLKLIK